MRWREPTEEELHEWLYRTGACVSGRVLRTARTLRLLNPSRGILTGTLGSPGHESWWSLEDLGGRPVSCRDLLARTGMPAVPEIVERAKRWLREFPLEDPYWVMNSLHIEQRYGCWAAPQEYGHVDGVLLLSPYCHRRIVELILTLPAEYRQRGGLPWDLIASRWPQLLQVPFNEPIGLRAGLRVARRATRSALRRFFPPPHPVTVGVARCRRGLSERRGH
jgi:hypothetical protein